MRFEDELENKIMTSTPHRSSNHVNIFERGISYKTQRELDISDLKNTWLLQFSAQLFLLIAKKSKSYQCYTIRIKNGNENKQKISIDRYSFT